MFLGIVQSNGKEECHNYLEAILKIEKWLVVKELVKRTEPTAGGQATAASAFSLSTFFIKINDGHYLGSSITISMALLGQIV